MNSYQRRKTKRQQQGLKEKFKQEQKRQQS